MMLGQTVMKAEFPRLVTELTERVTALSWARATTQSAPLKLYPGAQDEQMVAERQVAHLAGHD